MGNKVTGGGGAIPSPIFIWALRQQRLSAWEDSVMVFINVSWNVHLKRYWIRQFHSTFAWWMNVRKRTPKKGIILGSLSILLSSMPYVQIWQFASIFCLVAGLSNFATLLASLKIFSELSSHPHLLQYPTKILMEIIFPFVGSILLVISSGILLAQYFHGLRQYHSHEPNFAHENIIVG